MFEALAHGLVSAMDRRRFFTDVTKKAGGVLLAITGFAVVAQATNCCTGSGADWCEEQGSYNCYWWSEACCGGEMWRCFYYIQHDSGSDCCDHGGTVVGSCGYFIQNGCYTTFNTCHYNS